MRRPTFKDAGQPTAGGLVQAFELVEPIHVLVKAVRVTLVAVALLVLPVGVHSWRGAFLSHRVEQELAALPEEAGLGPRRLETESLEVVEARKLLGEQLAWIAAHLETQPGQWFGAAYTLAADHAQELAQGLAARASFYEGLDRLPGALWMTAGAPADAPSPRLLQQMAMRNALCARAWLAAQEPGGEHAAGRDLARALAIARVTDNGQTVSLMVRWMGTENAVLEVLDLILEQPMVDRDALLQPIRGEIEQALAQDRYRLLLDSDLRYLLGYESMLVANSNTWRLWFTTPAIMSERMAFLDTYREFRRSRLQDLTTERAGNDLMVRVLGTEEPAWMSWRTMARLELQRRDELTRRLSSF